MREEEQLGSRSAWDWIHLERGQICSQDQGRDPLGRGRSEPGTELGWETLRQMLAPGQLQAVTYDSCRLTDHTAEHSCPHSCPGLQQGLGTQSLRERVLPAQPREGFSGEVSLTLGLSG